MNDDPGRQPADDTHPARPEPAEPEREPAAERDAGAGEAAGAEPAGVGAEPAGVGAEPAGAGPRAGAGAGAQPAGAGAAVAESGAAGTGPEPEAGAGPEAGAAAAAGTGPEPEPALAGTEPAAASDQPEAEGAAGGEQIEWRPVESGGTIEWQPVVAGADEPADEPATEPEPEFDEEAWEAALKAEPATRHDGPGAGPGAGPGGGSGGAAGGGSGGAAGGGAAHPARGTRRTRPTAGGTPASPPAGGPGDGEGRAGSGQPDDKTKRQVVIMSVLTVFVLLVAVIGFMLSRGATKSASQATPNGTGGPSTTRPASGGTTVPATELTFYKDAQTGFSVRYPKTWNRLHPPVSDLRAVLVVGENDAVSFRILPIQTVATQENIGNFKAVTDAVVFGSNENKLIQEQLVLLNGKLSYYYLYTFIDKETNQQGVHAHYFVFEGLRILSVVFQSLPAEDFNRQAAVFDQVAESIVIDPAPPGATTVPVPTAVPTTVP